MLKEQVEDSFILFLNITPCACFHSIVRTIAAYLFVFDVQIKPNCSSEVVSRNAQGCILDVFVNNKIILL